MDLRDWLIVVGVVIIAGILLDGYRRMRLAKMDSLKMSRDMGGEVENTPIDDYNPELPGGGARIISKGDTSKDDTSKSVDTDEGIGGEIDLDDQDITIPNLNADRDGDFSLQSDTPIVADARIVSGADSLSPQSNASNGEDVDAVPVAHAGKKEPEIEAVNTSEQAAQEVLVINVDSKAGEGFQGPELKKLLEACGLDHGDMSIFHRHEEDDLLSPIQFSVANSVEPGYFDPNSLDSLSTPGVSFFMSLPGPKDYMKAFDYMLETAQCFARNLDGELRDENRSVMTAQTIDHCRQRIREFERKQLAKSRA